MRYTKTEIDLLKFLAEHGGTERFTRFSIKQIADRLDSAHCTIWKTLNRMNDIGHVEFTRPTGPHGKVFTKLTPKGAERRIEIMLAILGDCWKDDAIPGHVTFAIPLTVPARRGTVE